MCKALLSKIPTMKFSLPTRNFMVDALVNNGRKLFVFSGLLGTEGFTRDIY